MKRKYRVLYQYAFFIFFYICRHLQVYLHGRRKMESTIYSIIPPLLAIIMVIVTRRVLLSLGIGIITSALLLAQFNVVDTGLIIGDAMKGLVIDDGSLDTWNLFIILFLLILGVLTAFIQISGGSRAFGDWAIKRVKTRVGAQV